MPTLAGAGWCDGMAFLLRDGAPMPDLRPIREAVRGIWRGPLGAGADAPTLILVALAAPMQVDAATWPSALPLVATRGATLTSFVREAGAPAAETRPLGSVNIKRLELWWGGQSHRIVVEALENLPIADLWSMPRIHIHHPAARVRAAKVAMGTAGGVAGGAAGEGTAEAGRAPVSRASVPIAEDGADLLRDMAAQLKATEERTRLSSIVRQAFGQLFSTRLFGAGGGGSESGGQGTRSPRQPGLLENLAGWFRWHTPLGNGLRSQFGERLGVVEKMIASGDLDGALRLALKLGSDNPSKKPPSRYPGQVPGARATLDFDLAGEDFAAPIFGDGAYYALRARYLQLAEQLERNGDFRRAAYIHSQLLGDHHRAVLVLEKGQLFQEAAKLAIGSRQEPALAIRMLFLAGENDAALALARRTACFDQLAEDSRKKNPAYHAYVIKAWTDVLLATGQPLRALQVTDHLTEAAPIDDPLLTARRDWLHAALGVDEGENVDGELAIRGILTAAGGAPEAAILDWLGAVIRGDAEDAGMLLLDLLGHLSRLGAPDRAEQAAFWQGPGQAFVEDFARSLIATASSTLAPRDLDALRSVLSRAELPVLETDIGKLTKLHVSPVKPDREWQVPPITVERPAVKCACLLGNGNMLVWRESRLLQLLDRDGATVWQQNVSDVTGLIAIGSSPNVILVQAQQDGTSLLTRFASHSRTFHAIGKVALAAHHDITSESQWLVQIGGEIGALDLVKLCAPPPRIEFLWSCALTDRLRVIAFGHYPDGASWITRDVSQDRAGVVEIWSLKSTGELTTSVCLPARGDELSKPLPPSDWCWSIQHGVNLMKTTDGETPGKAMFIAPWSEDQERQARLFAAARARARMSDFDTVQACDFARPYVGKVTPANGDGTRTTIGEPGEKTPAMILKCHGAAKFSCVSRGRRGANPKAGTQAGAVLLADDHGRLFEVAPGDRRVRIL